MRFSQKCFVSVDCIDTERGIKLNFVQEVNGYTYWNKDYDVLAKGNKVAERLACLRARKLINSLPSYRVVSTKLIPSTTLGWKNN